MAKTRNKKTANQYTNSVKNFIINNQTELLKLKLDKELLTLDVDITIDNVNYTGTIHFDSNTGEV